MTEQTNPSDPAATPDPPSPAQNPTFEQRVERFGQETEEAGRRLASNPAVADAADTAARVWGLIVLGVGLWFLAEVTLGYDMPTIPWRELWPLGLIGIGLAVIVRGLSRRGA